ncbi:hypothetical protein GQ600_27403 [Phytophthora cactorum]|nr:hypothetical protein GQ600_27401 [Phytophthora cactorum]KAF1786220.1 hypothetical protein GQ600_27402 [Phytophthora cactorum]KAF1786221.1 hypothetical protein GQ600_27403 [Phytophthora cactorum]
MLFASSNAVMTSRRDQIKLSEVGSPDHVQSTETNTDINRFLRSVDDQEDNEDSEDSEDSEERGFESYFKAWHKNRQTSADIKKDLGIAGLKYRYGKGSDKLKARTEYQKWKGYKEYLKDNPLA